MSARRVAWPTITGDESANAARAKSLVAAAAPALDAPGALRVEVVDRADGYTAPEGEPALAGFHNLKVAAVKGDVIALTRSQSASYSYACKTTNRIDRITDSGQLIYQQRCKFGEREWKLDAKLTFAELPPGVTIEAGDVLTFTSGVCEPR